jgi:hypothetical protein
MSNQPGTVHALSRSGEGRPDEIECRQLGWIVGERRGCVVGEASPRATMNV